ncbi:hypothetical protein [Tateyamaria omphalii]|uniref:DUF5666 domain-containing protein n=1 Tax=Tateyamaria omphalii TaxID=299262 RepID=A0A1P8N230_9RHOB|nr:hypothetical protein [Tateyamaria omphalii]APX14373.1 hypothetical protein BWR18_21280 [Tateyamaria omphalii]
MSRFGAHVSVMSKPPFFAAPGRRASQGFVALMAGGMIVLTGEVVPNVTCPAIRTAEGKTVALSHLPGAFAIGDMVTVTGSGYAPSATCQQEVLVVTKAAGSDG